jgi:glucuronoarabinoxylan endo-1,4-beta-xylanase
MTEHLILDTLWSAAITTGKEISDCMNAGMSAYLWWYIKRFYGPLDESGNVTRRGYVMSQFARFARPGFSRVGATAAPRSLVDVSAYAHDQSIVIVALNRNSSPLGQTFILKNGSAVSFTPYVTSGTKNCMREDDVGVRTNSLTVTLDALSVTTFVSN